MPKGSCPNTKWTAEELVDTGDKESWIQMRVSGLDVLYYEAARKTG